MAEDHYDVPEVSRKASPDMVRKAYRIQLATHHPDRGGDAVRAQMINEAFCVLGDPVKRRAYDDELTERETKRRARQTS
ncbi:J domain-containing protein [Janibacter limosus]|nr:J domain-containing protein [Janibacter limosus]